MQPEPNDLIQSVAAELLSQDISGGTLADGTRVISHSTVVWDVVASLERGDDLWALLCMMWAFRGIRPTRDRSQFTYLTFLGPPLYRITLHASSDGEENKFVPKGEAIMTDARKRFPPLAFRITTGHGRKQLLRALYVILIHGGKADREHLWDYLQSEGLKEHVCEFSKDGEQQARASQDRLEREERVRLIEREELVRRARRRAHRKKMKKMLAERRQGEDGKEGILKVAGLSLSPIKENVPGNGE